VKKYNLLLILLSSLPSLSFTNIKSNSIFSITSFEVDLSKDKKTVTLTNRYTTKIESNYYVGITWFISKDGVRSRLDYIRLSNIKVRENEIVPKQPTVDVSTLGDNNEFILYIYTSDTKEEKEIKVRFNIKGKTNVTFSEKDNDVGVSSGYIVESYSLCDEKKNYIQEDRITFSNYEDIIVEDYYLNFDIRRFKYSYSGLDNYLKGNFYLLIYDKYNLFIDLPIYKDSQYRYLELIPKVFNGDSIFSFKNIYYNPLTHNTSSIYKEGYKETDKLYFPIGQLNKLRNIHCLLSFDIEGYTNFNMSSEFDIYFLKNYFGDCIDSEYCIEMNADEGSNIREKVVDIVI